MVSLLTALWFIVSRGEVFQSLFFTNIITHSTRKSFINIINVIKTPYWGKSVQRHGVFQTGIFLDWFRLLARFAFTDYSPYREFVSMIISSFWLTGKDLALFYKFLRSILRIHPQMTSSLHIQLSSDRCASHNARSERVVWHTYRKGKTGRKNLF